MVFDFVCPTDFAWHNNLKKKKKFKSELSHMKIPFLYSMQPAGYHLYLNCEVLLGPTVNTSWPSSKRGLRWYGSLAICWESSYYVPDALLGPEYAISYHLLYTSLHWTIYTYIVHEYELYVCIKQGLKWFTDFPKFTQTASNKSRIWTQVCLIPQTCSFYQRCGLHKGDEINEYMEAGE